MTCSSNSIVTTGRRFAALFFVGVAMASMQAHGAPYQPKSDTVVLATVPAGARSAAKRPQDLQSAIMQAADDVELARTSGDPRYLGYAQAALQPWWQSANAPLPVVLIRAQVHQHNHAFKAALADLDHALSVDPRNAQAHLTRSAIHQVQGNYAAAEADCRSLVLTAPPLTTADCLSRVISHRGQAEPAYQKLAALSARFEGSDARQLKEVKLTLADIATRLGDREAAMRHYETALGATEADAYTLLSFADFLLDSREFQRVAELFAQHPTYQDLLLRAALAARATNAANSGELARRLREQFQAHQRRGDFVPTRDYARFLLDIESDAPSALNAALFNWRSQREPADARIVLRAAIAAHDPDAAAPVIGFIQQNNLQDVRLTSLLGLMHPGTG